MKAGSMRLCICAMSVLVALVSSNASGQDALRPNIVFIVADDLGWGDVGWHDSEIKTPRLTRLQVAGRGWKRTMFSRFARRRGPH